MNREKILSILYEMALVIGSETSVQPLLTRTLQRLMQHTSFPAGMILSGIARSPDEPDAAVAKLEVAIGDFDLARLAGNQLVLPARLIEGDSALVEDRALLDFLPCRKDYYAAYLRMPIEGFGAILLVAPTVPSSELPVTSIFRPVLSNLAKALHLCQRNEAATAELIAQRNLAAQANQAKSVFLANMSHELRTPLTSVLGFAKLMVHDPAATPTQREYLSIINRSGEHLLGLINGVLDMSKIEAGRVELELAPLELHSLIRDLVEMMDVRCKRQGLDLSAEVAADVPRYVFADRSKMRQVLTNLLGNSVKFTRRGGVTLRVRWEERGPQGWLIAEVEDSGIGIAPGDLARIFEPFAQAGPKDSTSGTGLGLAITRQYVALMGGHMSVQSELGHGSIFRFEIPVQLATPDQVAPAAASPGRVISLAAGQRSPRVLVADDTEESCLLMRRLLEPVGFKVLTANDGQQAIDAFQAWTPEAVLMDIRMPRVDGITATRRIRAMKGGKKVFIVALTASAFREQRESLLEAGCDDVLTKPYREEDIFAALARLLGVRYLYEAEVLKLDEGGPPSQLVEREALLRLPPPLRQSLRRAALECDCAGADQVIRKIRATEPASADALTLLVETFRFSEILALLEAVPEAAAGSQSESSGTSPPGRSSAAGDLESRHSG